MQIVTECQSIIKFRLPSVIIPDRCESFRVNYESCNNSLYKLALSPGDMKHIRVTLTVSSAL